MQLQNICNLLATLSKPPWTKPLNWRLQMTWNGEERIPFHLYVQSDAVQPCSLSKTSSFPGFNQLPVELQLRILTFCSAPTLYQIMHTSMLRTEAAKLFWSDPNAYYFIEAYWLMSGAYSGCTYYDLSFMAYAQNIEIEYDVSSDNEICCTRDEVLKLDYKKVQEFWKTFQTRFPRAKRVVLNKNWESTYILYHDNEPVDHSLKALIEACPVEIDVLAFVLEEEPGGCKRTALPLAKDWHRVLYQLADDDGWRRVTTSGFERKTILIPPKRFRGPVGEFEELEYEGRRIHRRQEGLMALIIEALDRHHFDKKNPEPFHCPLSGCDIYFEKAGQWTQHAAEAHGTKLNMTLLLDILPNALKYTFEEQKNNLEQEMEVVMRKFRKINNDWNEKGMRRGGSWSASGSISWRTIKHGIQERRGKRVRFGIGLLCS